MSLSNPYSSSLRHMRAGRCALAILSVALVLATSGSALAAKPAKNAKEAKDSAPVLMSKTGGGDSWADLTELQQAAQKGNPKAETQLGEMLLRGEGIAKDEARGVALLEKAARAGQSAAAFRIGMLLSKGEGGVAQDPVRALAYFRAAAAGGEAEAFFNIGAAYGSARGVKRDYAEALGWLILARQHGADPRAEQSLRTQIKDRADWITKGEKRAKEIEREFADKKVTDFLPAPAPLDQPIAALPKPR
jgi:TPR repeat protein